MDVDAVLLCFACAEIPCALELLHQSDVFYSSLSQLCSATQSVQIAVEWLRQPRFLAAAGACVYYCVAAESRESHCKSLLCVKASASKSFSV